MSVSKQFVFQQKHLSLTSNPGQSSTITAVASHCIPNVLDEFAFWCIVTSLSDLQVLRMSANNYHVSLLPFICIMHSVMVAAAVIHEKHSGHKSLYHLFTRFIHAFGFQFSWQSGKFRCFSYLKQIYTWCRGPWVWFAISRMRPFWNFSTIMLNARELNFEYEKVDFISDFIIFHTLEKFSTQSGKV